MAASSRLAQAAAAAGRGGVHACLPLRAGFVNKPRVALPPSQQMAQQLPTNASATALPSV